MCRESGDQKGYFALSVPASDVASKLSNGCSHSRWTPSSSACPYTSMLPSGDKAGDAKSPPSANCVVFATGIVNRRVAEPAPSGAPGRNAKNAATSVTAATSPQGNQRSAGAGCAAVSPGVNASPRASMRGSSIACSSSSRASPASRMRLAGSRVRQRRNNNRTIGGVSSGSFDQSGSLRRIAASESETVSPANRLVPVRHS